MPVRLQEEKMETEAGIGEQPGVLWKSFVSRGQTPGTEATNYAGRIRKLCPSLLLKEMDRLLLPDRQNALSRLRHV